MLAEPVRPLSNPHSIGIAMMMRMLQRFAAAIIYAWLACGAPAVASQSTLVTPGAPLSMSTLASFLNQAFLSIGSCNSGTTAPANGTGNAAFPGECWINTTSNPWVFSYTPDGTNWVEFGALNTSTLVWSPYSAGRPVPAIVVTVPNVNFNSANTDTTINIPLPPGYSNYRFSGIAIGNASGSLTNATFGIFSGAGGTGTAIVSGGAPLTISTSAPNTNNNAMFISGILNTTGAYNFTTVYFRVGTAEGSAATATVTLIIQPLS